jgi:hypothetical protein
MERERRHNHAAWLEWEAQLERDEKRKAWEEMQRKKEEAERKAKVARAVERARKCKRAKMEEEKDKVRDKKGKWPQVLDL